jgi:outer membrane protein
LQSNPSSATCNTFPMKKFLLLTAAALIFPAASYADLKVGTVDMNRAFKEYNKTKDSEKKINEAKDAAKKEYDDRAENYKKALDEINKLNQQLDSPALSADKKTSMAKDRDDKIANIKNMEREINEFRQTRERQLQEQAMRMRESIVKEITDVIMERVKSSNYDLVFDKTGPSMNGVNVVLYSKDAMDFTTDIITALNKKPVTTTTEKPATSPATTTAPATTPKKP